MGSKKLILKDLKMTRQKFLTFSNQITGHGSFSRHQRMARALVNQGSEVIWIAPPGYFDKGITVIDLSLNKLPNFAFLGLYIKLLVTFIKNFKQIKNIDKIFILSEYHAICMILMPFFIKIPIVFLSRGDVITLNEVNKPDNKKIIEKFKTSFLLASYPWIQKVVLRYSDTVVVQAKFLLKYFQDRHKGLQFNGLILKNDCPKTLKIHKSSKDLNLNENFESINLAFISPLFWECKGLGVIVDVVKELERRNVKFTLHIVGDGPHMKRMKKELNDVEIDKKIIWYGWLTDLSKVVCNIDLTIVPSLYDSSPNLILEMLAIRVPLLASNIPAHKEMLIFDEILFEDYIDLCNRIELYQSSNANRHEINKLLKERKHSLTFDWDKHFSEIMQKAKKNAS